jgi:hypothetical protein
MGPTDVGSGSVLGYTRPRAQNRQPPKKKTAALIALADGASRAQAGKGLLSLAEGAVYKTPAPAADGRFWRRGNGQAVNDRFLAPFWVCTRKSNGVKLGLGAP